MRLSKNFPFWLITLAIVIGLPGVTLIQDGMFMDAMLYTSVAHNQGQGIGTFWFPQFSKLNLNISGVHAFHEQPPLVFGIQSVFFRILGSSMYVERFYVFLTTCVTAGLIHVLWRVIFKTREDIKKLSWLPIFFWITIPTVFWGASNNVNENTMGIFTQASVLCSWVALQRASGSSWRVWILSGIFIVLATLSKGFPGFFPLCVPFIYGLTTRKISIQKALLFTLIQIITILLVYVLLFQFKESHESLYTYLIKRAFQRIAEAPTTTNRFQSLASLCSDLLPAIVLFLIFASFAKMKKVKYKAVSGKGMLLFFFLTGLAGSAPLMLTMVQKAFYLIPCYPFFAIGFAILTTPFLLMLQNRIHVSSINFRILSIVSIILLAGSVAGVAAMKGKTGRDADILHDTRIVSGIIPHYSTITITRNAFYIDWELQCYLMRYYNISGDFTPVNPNTYMILDKREQPDRDISAYVKLDLGLERYDLYQLKKQP